MALLRWEESFALGIPEVDYEHRALIDLINQVHDALSASASKIEIADFLAELHASVGAHFALEESIMQRCGYDQFAEHKAEHERLLDEICEVMDDHVFERVPSCETALADRLRAWFQDHFRNADRRLHDALPRAFAGPAG